MHDSVFNMIKFVYIERSLKMIYTKEVENMCPVAKGAKHEPAPIPEEGKWVHSKKIEISSIF